MRTGSTAGNARRPREQDAPQSGFVVEEWGWEETRNPTARDAGTVVAPRPSKVLRRSRRRRLSRRWRLVRTAALLLIVVLLSVALWSYVGALTSPGSASVGTRTIEWISNKVPGGRAVVLFVERLWYKWTAPPAGGTPPGGLPEVATPSTDGTAPVSGSGNVSQSEQGAAAATKPSSSGQTPTHSPAPAPVEPIAANPLPGEGQWQVAGRLVQGLPALMITYLRPDAVHTSLVAGVMWLDTKLLRAELVPGTQLPGQVSSWSGLHFSIPPSARANLLATFNSGFLLRDSGGGWYGQGHMVVPLVDGKASLVIYKDGTATVAQWGRDATMSANVVAVRQNLQLIVDQGQIAPLVGTDNYKIWGKTLGNTVLVWRSGVGVTNDGALIYAAGNKLSVQSLAEVLQRAGAVRAMELDINSKWTSANFYQLTSDESQVVSPTKLLPDMNRSAGRYLVPDERDFFAIFARY